MQITQALPLAKKMTLCCVGAGGKTSLIFALARELAAQNGSILVTTTTAMFHPDHGEAPQTTPYNQLVIGDLPKGCPGLPRASQIVVAAQTHDPKTNKLKGYSPVTLARILKGHSFDYILIEADGSKRLPIKAPADHEPVIPGFTNMVIGCIGLDCLGRPLDSQTVHRPEIFSAITKQIPGPIGSDHILSLVAAPQGLFKNTSKDMKKIVFFNKADTTERVHKAWALARRILKECPVVDDCLVACLQNTKNPIY